MSLPCSSTLPYFLAAALLLAPAVLSAQEAPVSGVLSSFGYGYEVTVRINDLELSQIEGGESESIRIFSSDHPMMSEMPADTPGEVKSIFCLEPGENRIRISFEQIEAATPLEVKIEVTALSDTPVFRLLSEATESADAEFVFEIAGEGSSQGAVEVGDQDLER